MIALKNIQTSFTATRHTISQSGRLSNTKNSILRFSKSNDSDSESETPPPEGDTRKQELLVRIAMLQAQKVRLADYLVLIGLLLIEIVDSFITSTPDWRKVAVLGVILVGLVSQFMLSVK